MAVVNVKEAWSGRTAFERREGQVYVWGAVKIYTVLCDMPTEPAFVIGDAGLPAIGAAHNVFTYAYLVEKTPEPISPYLIQVTCRYEGKDSPLAQPSLRWFSPVSSIEPIDTDYNGVAITNPLKRPYEGLQIEWTDLVFNWRKNLATFPLSTMYAYMNTINSDVIVLSASGSSDTLTVAANCARFIPQEPQYMPDGNYWQVWWQVALRAETWKLHVPCIGPTYWDGASYEDPGPNTRKKQWLAHDGDRSKTGGKIRLSATGLRLADAAADVFQDFEIYTPVPYAPLGLNL